MPNIIQSYLLDVVERAGKTGVQAALLDIGYSTITHFNILSVNWLTVGEFAAGGFVLSVLSSFASGPIPNNGTASLIPAIQVGTTLKKASKTVPTTADGQEYETYQGHVDPTVEVSTVATQEPVTVETVTPAPVETPLVTAPGPVVESGKTVEYNADGTILLDGVLYTKVG